MKIAYYFSVILLLFCGSVKSQEVFATGMVFPSGLAIHDSHLYTSELFGRKITKIPLDATDPTQTELVVTSNFPTRIVVKDNVMYISEIDGITKINLDGNVVKTDPFLMGLESPGGLAFYDKYLYVAVTGSDRLSRIDLTKDTMEEEILLTDLYAPIDIVVKGSDLYLLEIVGGKVSKFNLEEETPNLVTVTEGLDLPYALAIDDKHIYVAEYRGKKVSRINLEGDNYVVEDVVSDLSAPYGIAVDGTDLYIANYLEEGSVLKFDLNSLSTKNILTGEERVLLYPNPTSQYINIDGLEKKEKYTIYNSAGAVVKSGEVQKQTSIDVQNLAAGVYILKLDSGKSFKFMKK